VNADPRKIVQELGSNIARDSASNGLPGDVSTSLITPGMLPAIGGFWTCSPSSVICRSVVTASAIRVACFSQASPGLLIRRGLRLGDSCDEVRTDARCGLATLPVNAALDLLWWVCDGISLSPLAGMSYRLQLSERMMPRTREPADI
jgi:hypothetical protein